MKITYVLTTAEASRGTERAIITQANWMARYADVSILSLYKGAPTTHFPLDNRVTLRHAFEGPIPDHKTRSLLIPTDWDNQYDATTDAAVEKAFRAIVADIVVTTTPAQAFLAARLLPTATKIVHEEHRNTRARGNGVEPLLAAAPRIDCITVLTEANRKTLNSMAATSDVRVDVIPNAINVAGFSQSSLRQPLVVGAGGLVPGKQFHYLIAAFELATRDHPDWRLRIYGEGPAKRYMRIVAHRFGIEGRVELPGLISDMEKELAKGSIFAQSSRSEALPLTLLEAQAAGVPVVSFDTPTGPREIIEATAGGLVVPFNSVGGLATGIQALIEDEGIRRTLGTAGRAGAWQFDEEAVLPRWRVLFEELMRPPSRRARSVSNRRPQSGLVDELSETDTLRDPDMGQIYARLQQQLDLSAVPSSQAVVGQDAWGVTVGGESIGAVLQAIRSLTQPVRVRAYRGNDRIADEWVGGAEAPVLASYADRIRFMDEAGHAFGIVELWRVREGKRVRPYGAAGPAWVDDHTWSTWMSRRSVTPSGRPYWSQGTFDVDVVYTWVDGADPAWRARRAPYLPARTELPDDGVTEARFRNRDELLYSVRSVRRFMPWVRKIFIVTDRQQPTRVLEEFPDVDVIDHRDIFPDVSVLPVFNSHAIEASLHRIPGLAEHFLYFNDDFIVARSQPRSHFFEANGIAKFFPYGEHLGYGSREDVPHLAAGENNRDLIRREFGIEITRNMIHVPYAHLKSSLFELEDCFPEAVEATRRSKFRDPADYSIASSLGLYFGFAKGRYVSSRLGYAFVSLRADGLEGRLSRAASRTNIDIIAIGEPGDDQRRHRDEDQLIKNFLERIVGGPR